MTTPEEICPSFIITLTGPSMCGKSYVIEYIKNLENILYKEEHIIFSPICISKYTTRPYRTEEIKKQLEEIENDVISCEELPDDCDFIYQTYGNKYGFSSKKLEELLAKGKIPVVIINDVRVVEEVKKSFPQKVLALFLFREVPKLSSFQNVSEKRGNVSEEQILQRYNKSIAIFRTYIENIALFNRVILNPKEQRKTENYAQIQIRNVIMGVITGKIKLNKKSKNGSKLFIISGNAASGKDEIIQAVNEMGSLQGSIIPKYTSRMQDETDGNEMICKYIPKKELLDKYEIEYQCEFEKKKVSFIDREKHAGNNVEKRTQALEINLSEKRKIRTASRRFWDSVEVEREKQKNNLRTRILNESIPEKKISNKELFKMSFDELFDMYCKEGYHKNDIDPIDFLKKTKINEQDLINLILKETNVENNVTKEKLKELNENELWKLYEKDGFHDDSVDVCLLKRSFQNEFLEKFYDKNPEYIIDLEKVREDYSNEIELMIKGQKFGMTGPAYYIEYNNYGWIMYENNQTLYAFKVCRIQKELNKKVSIHLEKMKKANKHCVLVASLIDIFALCKEWFGDDIVTVFAYSEISSEEFEKNSKAGTVTRKLINFEQEIEKYSRYIAYFDHVTIYAESEMAKKNGGKKEELIDQIFRLFRYYSK